MGQLKFLQDKQLDEIQGLHFTPPVTDAVLEDFLIQQHFPETQDPVRAC